jgi:hypothetical protein
VDIGSNPDKHTAAHTPPADAHMPCKHPCSATQSYRAHAGKQVRATRGPRGKPPTMPADMLLGNSAGCLLTNICCWPQPPLDAHLKDAANRRGVSCVRLRAAVRASSTAALLVAGPTPPLPLPALMLLRAGPPLPPPLLLLREAVPLPAASACDSSSHSSPSSWTPRSRSASSAGSPLACTQCTDGH